MKNLKKFHEYLNESLFAKKDDNFVKNIFNQIQSDFDIDKLKGKLLEE